MPASERPVDHLATAIIDGTPIDWRAAAADASDGERRLIDELRLLSTVAEVHRHHAPPEGDEHPQQWGRLRLINGVGSGSFGNVYRAWDPRLRREVALKLIATNADADEDRAASILREARLLARVRHPGVVTIYDAEQIGTQVGLCMEFVEGPTLEQRLAQNGVFTASDTIAVGLRLCDALSAVHAAGVLHRDIKAANVVVKSDDRIVLMDFGAGRHLDDAFAADVTGTPLYLAPEVLQGEDATVRSDVYSVGVLLYHMLTGEYPVEARSLSELRIALERRRNTAEPCMFPRRLAIPDRFAAVLTRATDPNPERRHATVADLAEELLALQQPARRRVAATWILLGLLAVVIAVGASQWSTDLAPIRRAPPTADNDAYLAYLRGTSAYQQASSDTSNLAQARAELEHAVERDPKFALAWAWLSRVYASLHLSGANRTPETKRAAERAAQTAIDVDSRLPEGHLALGFVSIIDRDYGRARRELEIARVGLPESSDVLRLIGLVEQRMGRWPESLAAHTGAFEIDPAGTSEALVLHYMHMRRYPEARRYIELANAANRAAALVPEAWMRFSESGDVSTVRGALEAALGGRARADGRVRGLLARLEWFDGRYERALELINGMDPAGAWRPANFRFPASLAAAQVYESMGRREEAARSYAAAMSELERRERASPDDYQIEAAMGLAAAGLGHAEAAVRHGQRAVELLPVTKDAAEGPLYLYILAEIHAGLGQREAAFGRLDEMFSVPGFHNEIWVLRDPRFAALRNDPEFPSYMSRWSSQKGDVLLPNRPVR